MKCIFDNHLDIKSAQVQLFSAQDMKKNRKHLLSEETKISFRKIIWKQGHFLINMPKNKQQKI